MRFLLTILFGAAQMQTQTQATVADAAFCADLRQFVAAAREAPPFASLKRLDPDAERLGGAGHCHRFYSGEDRFHCRVWTRSAPDGRPGLAARVQACLPGTVRREIDDPEGRSHHERRLTRLRTGRVAVDITEDGGPGVHIGWYYSLWFHLRED